MTKRALTLLLLVSSSLSLLASPILAPNLAAPLQVDEGELLWNELNCAACHQGAPAEGRPAPRTGPVLGKGGLKLTPQYLRAFLHNPDAEKPGTTMPDVLHGMESERRADALESLVHFLAPSGEETNAIGSSASRIVAGRKLFHTVGCVACHAPEESWQAVMGVDPKAPIDPALTGTNSLPIGSLAKKMTVGELTRFLLDPVKYRKSGRMPSLSLQEGEAEAIAMYLLRAQASDPQSPTAGPKTIAGLQYDYFERNFGGSEPNWDRLRPVTSGTVDTFSLQNRRREQEFGFRFTGLIKIPAAGKTTFWTSSDDSSRLYIGDKLVVDNSGEHAPEEKTGSIELAAGEHPITVTFYNAGAGHELRVWWQTPGQSRGEIPASALSHMGTPMIPLGSETFTRDTAKASKGKEIFASLGCAACHEHSEVPAAAARGKAFQEMSAGGGCLEAMVKVGLPDYHLDAAQRTALQTLLANKATHSITPSPEAQVWSTLAAFNCVACHTRDARGGPVNARLQYFFANAEGDLGDEGRIPPHLTKVGLKLRPEWMKEVLEKGALVRPYMTTRMPQFGSAHVASLPALFEKADGDAAKSEPALTARDEKFGRKLVGTGGLSCISCHMFASKKSLGIPAMDMAFMTRRLKADWFHRYLIDPAALRPGTRMPTFWPGGEAANKEILDGNTAGQINAIWAYLSKGRDADLPQGLVTGRKEIVAVNEAVIYRNFIQGAGTRAIGVGYPEKANLAFDANEMRIAEIWQGGFIDAARHSSGRGEGFEPPLGDRVYKMTPGAPFAILDNAQTPWPAETGAAARYQMKGYQLDEKRRPSFHYDFGEIHVTDAPLAVEGEIDPYFKRAFNLSGHAPAQTVWFRAAVGEAIEKQADGSFLVDKKVAFKLAGVEPIVRRSAGKSELLAPIGLQNGATQFTEEIRW